jgi:hypothetical protein
VKRLFILITFMAVPLGATAQTSPVVLQSGIERDVSMYRWVFGGMIQHAAGPWVFEADNQFRSDAFILFEDALRFRDENQLRWRLTRPISAQSRSISEGRLSYFSQSRVLIQSALTGIEYQHSPRLVVRPSVGVALDQRPGARIPGLQPALRTDAGPAFGLAFHARPETAPETRIEITGDGAYHSIRPRHGRTVSLMGSAQSRFEQTLLNASVSYGGARRDVYQSASFLNRGLPTDQFSETIEAATSDTMLVGITVQTPITGGLSFLSSIDAGYNRRLIRTHRAPEETLFFDTDFDRRAVELDLQLLLDRPSTDATLALTLGANAESRRLANRDRLPPAQAAQKGAILQQADFDRSLVSLRSSVEQQFGRSHSVRTEALASIVRRDTPALNLDDRDEAYHSVSIRFASRWSRYVQSEISVFGSYYHTVYLNAARSAENNKQRSLRLRPAVTWTPSQDTRVRLMSEVRATYTVDDFVLQTRRPRDQSAREMRFNVDVEQNLGHGLRLLAQGGYDDLRLGRLIWSDFAEIPFDTLRTYTTWIRLQAGGRVTSEIGARAYVRTSYTRSIFVRYESPLDGSAAIVNRPGREWITQIGPTSSITAYIGDRSEVTFLGWLNVQRVFHDLYGPLPEEEAGIIRDRARSGTRLVIPNLTLQVRWAL